MRNALTGAYSLVLPATETEEEREAMAKWRTRYRSRVAALLEEREVARAQNELEQRRRQMQKAADSGNYMLAGDLQEEIRQLMEVEQKRRQMKEVVDEGDYMRAGRLQEEIRRGEHCSGKHSNSSQNDKEPQTKTMVCWLEDHEWQWLLQCQPSLRASET